MIYDFDKVTDRHHSDSVKWDLCDPGVIPMWIADMDFQCAPFIVDAVRRRAEHGIFGYTQVPDEYYESVINWFEKRRGWKIEKNWIRYIGGLVPALSVAVDALTPPGSKVAFHTPAYNCFFSCVEKEGRVVLECPLVYDCSGSQPTFKIDFDAFEKQMSDPDVHLYVLCNPHNPVGRVWSPEELARIGSICRAHGVTVVSDEIHCELEMPGHKYTPFAAVSEANQFCSVSFNSPSKSFNIAGLGISNIVTSDEEKYQKILATIRKFDHCDLNPFGVEALMAAYTPEGEEWLRQLNTYIFENYQTFCKMMSEALPQFPICKLEATYLAWMDCSYLTSRGVSTENIQRSLTENEKVWINAGGMYGDINFMRINLACPRETLVEGTRRIISGLQRLLV